MPDPPGPTMPDSSVPIIPILQGTFYSSWTELKEDIENWAISEHFSYRVPLKDTTRVDYRCRDQKSGCNWRVYASLFNGELRIKIVEAKHTCAGASQTPREVSNTQAWLRRTVPKHLVVTRDTGVREIIDCMQMHYHVKVNREAARLARSMLVKDRLQYQQEQFQQIPAYLTLLHEKNHFLFTDLHISNNSFQRVFICPVQFQLSFIQMRKFMAVDGTFLKSRFVQTLLLAVGIDANGHNLLLAWAIVESENTSSWEWLFLLLKRAIPQCLEMTLISDRDKGLLAADGILGSGVDRLICCFHLKCNFVRRYRRVERFFWPIANAKTQLEHDLRFEELQHTNPAAATYLAGVDRALWVTCYFSGQNFGHKTSNVVESMNNLLKDERELSILDLLNEIWHLTMSQRFKRHEIACILLEKNQVYTDFCLQQLRNSERWAQKNTVRMASRVLGEVTQANDRVYIVNLADRICDCGHFQENGIPCGHAFTCIYALNQSPRDYVSHHFSVQTWKNTNLTNLQPVTIENLPVSNARQPPSLRRAPAGRPRTLRLTAGSRQKYVTRAQALLNGVDHNSPLSGQGSQACRICGIYGHNRKTCTSKSAMESGKTSDILWEHSIHDRSSVAPETL